MAMNQPTRLDPALAALLMQMRLPIRREFGVNLDIYDQDAITQFAQYGLQSKEATLQHLAAALQARLTGQLPEKPSSTPRESALPAETKATASETKSDALSPKPITDNALAELKQKTVQVLTTICGPMAEIMWAAEIKNCATRDALAQQILSCRQAIHATLGKAKADAFWKQIQQQQE